MSTERIDLDDGKYTVVNDKGRLSALRHGEPWRDLTGDNLIYWMMVEIQRQKRIIDEVNAWIVCSAIASPADMMGNASRIAQITAEGFKE